MTYLLDELGVLRVDTGAGRSQPAHRLAYRVSHVDTKTVGVNTTVLVMFGHRQFNLMYQSINQAVIGSTPVNDDLTALLLSGSNQFKSRIQRLQPIVHTGVEPAVYINRQLQAQHLA